jgi:hypothetical protein
MRTTVTLDEELVRQIQALYGKGTKTAAVTKALHEHIRMARLGELADLLGTIKFNEEVLRTSDSADLERAVSLSSTEDSDA